MLLRGDSPLVAEREREGCFTFLASIFNYRPDGMACDYGSSENLVEWTGLLLLGEEGDAQTDPAWLLTLYHPEIRPT